MKHFSGFSGSPSRRQLFAMWERVSILVWSMDCNDMDCCCMTKVNQDASNPGHCHMYEKRRRFGERKNQGGLGERTKLKAKKNSPIPPHLICTFPQLPALYAWQRLLLSLRTPKTTIGLVGKTTTLHAHLSFLYISLPFLRDYAVKLPNFTFYWRRKQATRKFILFLNLNMVLRNSTPGGFAYIGQCKWVGIIAIKTEKREFIFEATFSLPSRHRIVKSLVHIR